jgi:hypothetical protein
MNSARNLRDRQAPQSTSAKAGTDTEAKQNVLVTVSRELQTTCEPDRSRAGGEEGRGRGGVA